MSSVAHWMLVFVLLAAAGASFAASGAQNAPGAGSVPGARKTAAAPTMTSATLARRPDAAKDHPTSPSTMIWAGEFKNKAAEGWALTRGKGPASEPAPAEMCITSHHRGEDDANWGSQYGFIKLTPDSVIEVRATVSTNNRKAFQTPTWMLVYDNFSGDGQRGQNEYGGEVFFLDNEGGANSPIPGVGRSVFTAFLMPIALQTPQFSSAKDGFFSPALDARNDMRLMFRVLSLPAYESSRIIDPTTICLEKLEVHRRSLADMVVDKVEYAVDRFADANETTATKNAWQLEVQGQEAAAKFNGDGSVTIAPATDWAQGTTVMFRPGDSVTNLSGVGDTACNNDNWPIPWIADTTYYIEFMVSAPSEAAELDAPDVIRVGADALTSELVCDNFAVPNTPDLADGFTPKSVRGLSTPRFGKPQKYGCFFHTQSVTKSRIPGSARWRPKFEILTSNDLNPIGRTTNSGGVTIHSVTVKRVHFGK